MTKIFGDPSSFVDDSVAGFVDLYPHFVQAVPHGVIRSTATPEGKVAVIAGGGSGHYPAFGGYVGPGLADAAVESPSSVDASAGPHDDPTALREDSTAATSPQVACRRRRDHGRRRRRPDLRRHRSRRRRHRGRSAGHRDLGDPSAVHSLSPADLLR